MGISFVRIDKAEFSGAYSIRFNETYARSMKIKGQYLIFSSYNNYT
jgi:hypothetical protein